jgi:hypothetical protein
MRATRRKTGSAIAETGPALFVFFILIFFPLLDVIGMAAQYGAGWYLNHLVTRELACSRRQPPNGGPVAVAINNDFQQTGIGSFVGIQAINHNVEYQPGVGVQPPAGEVATVRCTTTINARPFITVPFFTNVPGLNQNMDLQFSNVRPREDTRDF